MNKNNLILLLLFGCAATASAADYSSEKVRANEYYRDLIVSRMDNILPKGTYYVGVQVELNEQKIRLYLEQEHNEIALPLGGILGTPSYSIKGEQQFFINIETLLKFVDNMKVKIGVTEGVTPQFRDWIKSNLANQLAFSKVNEGNIEFYNLPADFETNWANWKRLAQPETVSTNWKPAWMMLGIFLSFVGLLFGISIVVLRTFSKSLSKDINTVGSAFTETKEPEVAVFNKSKEAAAANQHNLDNRNGNSILERLDANTIILFAKDCFHSNKNKLIPFALVYFALDKDKCKAVESALSDREKQFPSPSDHVPTLAEIEPLILAQLSDYRFLVTSNFALFLADFDIESVVKSLGTNFNALESFVVVSHLAPYSRLALLEQTPLKKKLEWNQSNFNEINPAVIDKVFQKIKNGMNASKNSNAALTLHQAIAQTVIQPRTFLEDEELFYSDIPDNKRPSTLLQLLRVTESDFWDSIPVKDLATVSFGYSDKTVDQFKAKFASKKLNWFLSYVEQYRQAPIAFDDSNLIQTRQYLLNQIDDNKKAA